MGGERSKAVPKVFWLALMLVGLVTSYGDLRLRRPAHIDASLARTQAHAARLAQQSLDNNEAAHR